jgi:hypothetical protein
LSASQKIALFVYYTWARGLFYSKNDFHAIFEFQYT